MTTRAAAHEEIRRLRRQRPRDRFARASILALGALAAASWATGGFSASYLVEPRRVQNLRRFLGELVPYPLQGRPWDWGVAFQWMGEVMTDKGTSAVLATLAISIVAILVAGAGGLLLAMPAVRSLARPDPWLPSPRPAGRRDGSGGVRGAGWVALVQGTRVLLVFLRSIPEYVWAFLLIALVGPTAWPAVLALAIHNTGILGKLDAEVVEDLPSGTLEALRGLGAGRRQIWAVGILPSVMPRLLLFFFYRWETCVREATVLGMLGIVSLGFWIQDARARNHYDVMFFLILLGALLVLAGDLVSHFARRAVRRQR